MKRYLYVMLYLLLIMGCSTVPKVVPHPWNKTLSDEEIIQGSTIAIETTILSTPLIGSQELLEEEIAQKAKSLLERRGFYISNSNYQYKMKVLFSVEKQLETITTSMIQNSNYSGSAMTVKSGYGITLANLISETVQVSKSEVSTNQYDTYTYSFACEIYTASGKLIWKNDAIQKAYKFNVLDYITPMLQIAFSSLPKDENIYPRVPKIKETQVKNFLSAKVYQTYLRCPALPNLICFEDYWLEDYEYKPHKFKQNYSKNPQAFMVYIDLLQTAEFAIPGSKIKKWDNPLDMNNWRTVYLIGKYYLGNDQNPVNIVVKLKGTPSFYVVSKCNIVTDEEYNSYYQKYNLWINKLTEFFDFFEKG